jgi:DNA-binding YbaB/EbfC family protein
MGMGDQMKLLNQMRKLQKELAKEIVEVEAGDGAVVIQISGEIKVVSVKVDKAKLEAASASDVEGWIKAAMRDGLREAQEMAAEKMKPVMGGLGNLGL